MTTRSPMLAVLLALLIAQAVSAMGGLPLGAVTLEDAPALPEAGFSCALVARTEGRSTAFEGRVAAAEATRLTWALRVRGAGLSIDQSGESAVAAGGRAVLGEASVSGPLDRLDARLSVTVAGETTVCPLRAS